MSVSLDHAVLIQNRLATAPVAGELTTALDITGVPSNVDRYGAILGDIQAAVQKAAGTFISILWDGWTTLDGNASSPRIGCRYTIAVWARTVREPTALAPDDVMEAIMRRMWHWIPAGKTVRGEVQMGAGGVVPNKSFLVYDLEVIIPSSI